LDNVQMDGVIIVTTPQDLSLLDSSCSLRMYGKAGVLVIGLAEAFLEIARAVQEKLK